MDFGTIPVFAQWSILGLSIGMNLFVLIEFIRGTWTTRKNLDQVQRLADTFQKAWEVSEKKWEAVGPVLNNLMVTSDTILHIIQAAPKPPRNGDSS